MGIPIFLLRNWLNFNNNIYLVFWAKNLQYQLCLGSPDIVFMSGWRAMWSSSLISCPLSSNSLPSETAKCGNFAGWKGPCAEGCIKKIWIFGQNLLWAQGCYWQTESDLACLNLQVLFLHHSWSQSGKIPLNISPIYGANKNPTW